MPRGATKTSPESIAKMFKLCYEDGVDRMLIARTYGLHHAYLYRLLKAERLPDITRPLLAKYRPSWVKS